MGDRPRFFTASNRLLDAVTKWSWGRIQSGPNPTNGARDRAGLEQDLGGSITEAGIGEHEALRRFTDVIAPTARPNDHPYMLSYIPAAPTSAAITFDLAVSAAELFGSHWEAGSGAIHAENQALSWLASLANWPDTAGGCFIAGGTMGNLSALHAAREKAMRQNPDIPVHEWKVAYSGGAHSSIPAAARVMGAPVIDVPVDEGGRLNGANLRVAIEKEPNVFAVVATAGTTNAGIIDHLDKVADVCEERGIWMHVDGAYGIAGMVSAALRPKYKGISRADSFIVDPHKWMFAPYDCCALIYRQPEDAWLAHAQTAAYLDEIDREVWNPADYAIHLSRRVRGLPFWFSLATYGTRKYEEAIDCSMATCKAVTEGIRDRSDFLELVMEPDLSVVMFRRKGWTLEDMQAWSEYHRVAGTILCLPTKWQGEPVYRLCFVNPDTRADHVLHHLDSMKWTIHR